MTIEEILAAQRAAQDVTPDVAFEQLVGEGKKYATKEDLAKAALNGQVHIEQLEHEAVGYKESATKAKGVDELLALMQQRETTPPNQEPAPNQGDDKPFGIEQAEALIAKALGAKDEASAETKREANQKLVVDELVKLHGDNALAVYKKLSADLGADLNKLAGDSPSLVLQLIGSKRPSADVSTDLPPSKVSQPFGSKTPAQQGMMTQARIKEMYAAGTLTRYEKIELENQSLTDLGSEKFYS